MNLKYLTVLGNKVVLEELRDMSKEYKILFKGIPTKQI